MASADNPMVRAYILPAQEAWFKKLTETKFGGNQSRALQRIFDAAMKKERRASEKSELAAFREFLETVEDNKAAASILRLLEKFYCAEDAQVDEDVNHDIHVEKSMEVPKAKKKAK